MFCAEVFARIWLGASLLHFCNSPSFDAELCSTATGMVPLKSIETRQQAVLIESHNGKICRAKAENTVIRASPGGSFSSPRSLPVKQYYRCHSLSRRIDRTDMSHTDPMVGDDFFF